MNGLLDFFPQARNRLAREYAGADDALLTVLKNAAVQPVAGLSGLLSLARGGSLADAVNSIDTTQAYAGGPKTAEGARNLQAVGDGLNYVLDPLKRGVDAVGDQSPLAGAALAGLGAVIDPTKLRYMPKRMVRTNAALERGGDIARATGEDFGAIMQAAEEMKRRGEIAHPAHAARLKPQEVAQRRDMIDQILAQPLEPFKPPEHGLLDRSVMTTIPNQGGVPGVAQNDIVRYNAPRADLSHIESLEDPANLERIRKATARGLLATDGGFYKSYQPMRAALDEMGYPPDTFRDGLAAGSFASAQNTVAAENAIQSLLMNMQRQGIPINEQTVAAAKAAFKANTGSGLTLMKGHYEPFAKYLTDDFPSGSEQAQKITSFFNNKLGNYRPYTLDTHESAGLFLGTRDAPYWWTSGGMSKPEYGPVEKIVKEKVADHMGIDPAVAQEGRWFGLGELTGLKTGGGDWLDNFERQAAYSAHQLGKPMDRNSLRNYTVRAFAGDEVLLPWYSKTTPIPDYRPKLKGK